jgi:hypothetical protein
MPNNPRPQIVQTRTGIPRHRPAVGRLNATGDRIAHLFNTGAHDLIGAWGWRVWLDHKMHEGSAHNGTEVRETCERLLADYQQE